MGKLQDFFRYFENTGDGVFAVDGSQRIVFWSQTAQDLLGYTPEKVQGRCCYELLGGRDLGDEPYCSVHCELCEWANLGQPIHARDLRVKNGQGKFVWIDISSIVIHDFSRRKSYGAIVHLFRMIKEHGENVPPLKIRLLGPVMVQRTDGSPVDGDFQRRAKVRALFSLLALHRSHGLHRNDLLTTLWPNMNRNTGLHNLNTSIFNLRRSLEPALNHGPESKYIKIRGERYFLAGGRTNWLDVEKFESSLAAARRGIAAPKKIRLYRHAIALYRGDFLADLDAYLLDCWTERWRYEQLYLEALHGLGDELANQGRDDEATNLYLKVLAVDACHENVVQALMQLMLKNGKRIRAVSAYQKFKESLYQNLGTRPSSETEQLAEKARLLHD
jgi:PAS domain S-box-containing protein